MDKIDWSHLTPLWPQIESMAKVMAKGGEKYPKEGWKKMDNPIADNETKILRHFTEWKKGIEQDEESEEHPLIHAAIRCLMIAYFESDYIGNLKKYLDNGMIKEGQKLPEINEYKEGTVNEKHSFVKHGNVSKFKYPRFDGPDVA